MIARAWHATIGGLVVVALAMQVVIRVSGTPPDLTPSALRPDRDGRVWRPLRLAALCGITVTGIVYSAVLADIHQPHGAAETFVNTVVHYIVPITMVVGWCAFGPRPRVDVGSVFWSLIFPIGWLAYTLLRGAVWDWYPCPLLNVPGHGYAQVAVSAVLVTIIFALVSLVYATGDRALPPVPLQAPRSASGLRG